jgi:uncharacterized protein (TIGR02453 family)
MPSSIQHKRQFLLRFLRELSKNNNRHWFQENKKRYEEAKSYMDELHMEIRNAIEKVDSIGTSKVYRIYRDARFSQDKTPYKNHFAAIFMREQPRNRGNFYVHIEPGNIMVGGGFWGPEKDDLIKIRNAFKWEDNIETILQTPTLQTRMGNLKGEQLIKAPKGFEAEHARIDLIKKKQFIFSKNYSEENFMNEDFISQIVADYISMIPFFKYMTDVLTTDENGEFIV